MWPSSEGRRGREQRLEPVGDENTAGGAHGEGFGTRAAEDVEGMGAPVQENGLGEHLGSPSLIRHNRHERDVAL